MLTNTERQQIVEEVNAGTYGIDEALDDIAAAQKGEEVRKALYAEALVLNREGHAGSTDMIARQQIANLQTSVNGQISTLRTEVGEDIDDLETAFNSGLATQNGRIAAQDATIANVVANYNVEYGSTELWASTGETGALAAGTTVTLSEDVSHFDYIDIYSFCGNNNILDTIPVDAKLQSNDGYALRWVNLSDPGSGTYEAYVRIIETKIKIIGTTLTIIHQVTYSNGTSVSVSGAEITQSNRSTYMGELGIMKIVGRKITANTEVTDIRIGSDGTTYDSAGAAVRGQVQALNDAIPAVDDTLSVQGAAADAKVTGDKVTELKSDISDLDEFCRKEIITVKTGSGTATAGTTIASQTHLIDVNIANGSSYKIAVNSGGCFSKFHLYANGDAIKYHCTPGTEYDLVAGVDITWFSIYVAASDVTQSGTYTTSVSAPKETSNSLEERIDNLSGSVTDVSYLLEPDVDFFRSLYEVGANVNNDGNATYIYHEITFACDGKSMIGVQCDKIENTTANKPIVVYQKDGSTVIKTDYFSEANAIAGIKVIPLADTTVITVSLYASSTGGLTTTTAKYHNITVFTSNDGSYSIKDKCVPDKYAVPFYYIKNSYLQDKVDAIESLMKDANGNYDAFIFCTDQHWTLNAKQSPNLMNYICQRLNIPRLFMGGDYADGINLNALKAYRDAFTGKIYDVIGNHEYMNYLAQLGYSRTSHEITEGDIYAYINMHITDAISGDFGRGYYYVDNAMQKMRYIILSVYTDNGNSAIAQFEASQKTWFQNTALNLPDGYTAVIFAHYLYSVDYYTGAFSLASTTNDILSVVDAYSGNGEIACMIAGHTHVDGMTTTPGGIPVFITTCDKCKPWISGGTDMEPWISENREEGAITEQAFDVVIVNKTSKLISFVRIGAPADNGTGEKLQIRQQTYGD